MTPSKALNLTGDAVLDFVKNSAPLLNISEDQQESLGQVSAHLRRLKRKPAEHHPKQAEILLTLGLDNASPATLDAAALLADHVANLLSSHQEIRFKQWDISCIPMDSKGDKGITVIEFTLTAPFSN